jgi:hypothetical protein
MKKTVLLSSLFLATISTNFAQQHANVIIANGGQYEWAPPFNDRATIGVYQPDNQQYWVFDTIQVESVQDMALQNNHLFLAAQDSIIKYDLTTYKRLATIDYAGLKSLTVHDSLLIAGKFFGSGSFVSFYDNRDMSFLFDITEVNSTVESVVVVGDTAYVPFNQLGTVDLYPPYQVFADTIGKIAVIDIKNQSYVRTISLDTIGSGVRTIVEYNHVLFAICTQNGVIAKYDILSNSLDFDTIGCTKSIQLIDTVLYLSFGSKIGSYDVKNQELISDDLFEFNFLKGAIDTLNEQFYLTTTDYFNFGKATIFDMAGTLLHEFDVNVSPEAVVVDYKTGNFAPISLNAYYSIPMNSPENAFEVLHRSFDPNGDALTVSIITSSVNGTSTLLNNEILYRPLDDFEGVDSVYFKVCDVQNACDSAYLIFNVFRPSNLVDLERSIDSKLVVYPNPATDILHILFNLDISSVQIIDLQGRVVLERTGASRSLDISELTQGTYIVKVQQSNSVQIAKFVKQ